MENRKEYATYALLVFIAALGFFTIFLLSGCSKEKVGADTLEQARMQAKENAQQNAQAFRATNPQYSKLEIYSRGDSTISPECPQGDGWASIDLRTTDGQVLQKLKCSTVSLALGCLEAEDFKTKPYAAEEGRCNPDLPKTIQKLTK